MAKFVWLSDFHFTAGGLVSGHDPRVRAKAAVDIVNAHHTDAEAVIITGDLVNRRAAEDYIALKSYLDELRLPVYLIPGNHDDRELMRRVFGLDGAFIQHDLRSADARLLCVDTLKPGESGGAYCRERRDWLTASLTEDSSPTYLFMHHPPMRLGLPMQDQDMMEDGEAFLDLISAFPHVRHMFIGHVHRPISGAVRNIPFATNRAVLYQAPAPWPDWDWNSFAPPAEPPGLGVIDIVGDQAVLHHAQLCPFEQGGGS